MCAKSTTPKMELSLKNFKGEGDTRYLKKLKYHNEFGPVKVAVVVHTKACTYSL